MKYVALELQGAYPRYGIHTSVYTAETGSNLSSSVQQLELSKHYRKQDDYTNILNSQGESTWKDNLHRCTVNTK